MSSGKDQSVDLKLSPLASKKILDSEAPKAIPEDTSDIGLGEDGMPLNPSGGEPGVQFSSGGRDPANGDAKVEIGSTGVPHFVGLGKEELMKYANDPFWVRLRWILFALFWLIWLAMLAGAVIIIILAPKCANKALTEAQTTIAKNGPYYQVYVKSFAPGEKLTGLEEKIPYLKKLGVKTVIISQIADTNGQPDISNVVNFEAIDPSYGLDFEKFKGLVEKFKGEGLKVLLQFIPNHSSKSHPWFKSNPDFYVLKEKTHVDKSVWKGPYPNQQSVWSPVNGSDPASKYYLHQFQDLPDLNYKNSDLVAKMNDALKKWYETGIDGFLLSDVSYLTEDLDKVETEDGNKNQKDNMEVIEALVNKKKWDVDKKSTFYVLLDLNDIKTGEAFETYSKGDIAPVLADMNNLPKNFNETQLKDISESSEFVLRRLSSPRLVRLESKFGSKRANILAMVSFLLRGEVILYYGEELGMTSVMDAPTSTELDISTKKMDWFGSEKSQRKDFYTELISLHNSMNQTQHDGGQTDFYTSKDSPGIFAFKRETAKKYVVVVNLGEEERKINLKDALKISEKAKVVSVTPETAKPAQGDEISTDDITIPPDSGVVLELL